MLEWAVIYAAVAPHIKKYVTERAAKLASGYADSTAAKLYKRLMPDQKLQKAVESFVAAFDKELRSTIHNPTLTGPAYPEALKIFLADYDVLEALERPLDAQSELDWDLLKRRWTYLLDSKGQHLIDLPQEFDWDELATRYGKTLQKQALADPDLRQVAQAFATLQIRENTKRVADAAEQSAGPATGFDLEGYREFLRKKCSALQLAVMHTSTYQYDRKITLWSVFVPQSARESAPVQQIPREIERRMLEEGHLASQRDERQMEEFRQSYQSSALSPVLEILGRARLAVVLGNPGSGKTSLLKYLALRWVNEQNGPLPLFVDLREYIKERIGIPEYFAKGCAIHRLDARELDKRLKVGEATVFLDGLDEIFDFTVRGAVVSEIIALSSRYPKAQIVLTSRSFGYEPERLQNSGFLHATLEDFDDPQRKEFLRRWHEIAEDDPKERARLQSRIERALSESVSIRELAGNPLLLTMMAILNRNQELPRDRVELYREASRVLLGEWDTSRDLPVDDFARQEKEALLRDLAGEMQQAEGGLAGNLIERGRLLHVIQSFLSGLGIQESFFKAQKLIDQLTRRNFILAYAGADRFSFVHRTFLEYYCALWFVDRFEKKQVLTLEQLRTEVLGRHWKDESWHEVLRLITGMLEERKAEKLILFLMQQEGRFHKQANLILAVGCLNEVRNRRQIQATDEALWERFISKVVHYDLPYHSESESWNPEAAQLRQTAVTKIAVTWRGDKALHWLKAAAMEDQDRFAASAAVRELAQGWKSAPDMLGWLKEVALADREAIVRWTAIEELARGWKHVPGVASWLKERALEDKDAVVRWTAVDELAYGWKEDPGMATWLKERALKDKDSVVRMSAIERLAQGWNDEPGMATWLKERALKDKDFSVRMTATQELARGWKSEPNMAAWLKERALESADEFVRRTALRELARGWKDEPGMAVWLKERVLEDSDPGVRQTVVQELARDRKSEPNMAAWLRERALEDEHALVRSAAVEGLARGWKQKSSMATWLKERALEDESTIVRKTAVVELVRSWKHEVGMADWLKERATRDQDSAVRIAAVQELARGWKNESGIAAWLKELALEDRDESVCAAAFRELVQGWPDDPDLEAILQQQQSRSSAENVE